MTACIHGRDGEQCSECVMSLKNALETASREVSESPAWLKTIYGRNRAIAAIQADADPSFYSVIRYAPSAVAEEFMNVGVVVYGTAAGKERIVARFLSSWKPLHEFTGYTEFPGLDHLRQSFEADSIDVAEFKKMVANWANSIRFSEPRASLMGIDGLLEQVTKTFLYRAP